MSSRERKRSRRRKRKQRSSGRGATAPAGAGGNGEGAEPVDVEALAAEAEARGVSRSELKNEIARHELEPLEEGERPRVVTRGAILSLLIAASIVIAYLAGAETRVFASGVEVGSERPNPWQVFVPAALFGIMSWGMWRARYWAVLGFQAVMAIIMIGSFLALISATSVPQAIGIAAIFLIAGTFFWFTVKALARIQMPGRHLPS